MGAALTAEVRKLLSTRMWWIISLVMVAYLGFVAVVIAFSFSGTMATDEAAAGLPSGVDAAVATYSVTNPIGYVFPLLIGSMVFTTEFRHKTITGALLVEPSRGTLLLAKLVLGLALGLAYGAVGVGTVLLGGGTTLGLLGDGAFLGSSQVWSVLGWTLVAFAAWSMIGVAFGGLVTNQVTAIVAILAFTQFVEPIARTVGAAVESLSGVAQYLPGAAADAVIGASLFTSFAGAETGGDMLPRWAGLLMMLGYAAVFAVLARFVTLRRDIA
ncbi:ABC transporter permease [Aeromicrobium sp. CF4.19]|uniref:ABC transporter permease n=1 Tax=Aeromicrobium sp. CF4.19 TaxID=3373082 RepID=UPI003EE6DDA3